MISTSGCGSPVVSMFIWRKRRNSNWKSLSTCLLTNINVRLLLMYHGLNLIPYANSPNPLSHARARFVCIANLEISKILNLHMSEEDDDDDMPSRHAALALLVPLVMGRRRPRPCHVLFSHGTNQFVLAPPSLNSRWLWTIARLRALLCRKEYFYSCSMIPLGLKAPELLVWPTFWCTFLKRYTSHSIGMK